ncbi:ABC transporter permease [Zavarzinella formosa]|uniref:ABC transporter permease n=1 Tax=Zavarzinella formosa TaxID=360055 RepID=UPI0002F12B58|nr:ABC transporter permease [Zavarzinella formosa]
MLRIAGVLAILVALYATLFITNPNAVNASNLVDVANRQGFYGVLTLGVAILIITGSIDLSMGSVVGLSAVGFGLMMSKGIHPFLALLVILLGGAAIGCLHGLLVTRMKLQAFLVTLCGLFVYRGMARYLSEKPIGLVTIQKSHPEFQGPIDWLRLALIGKDGEGALNFPAQMFVLIVLAAIVGVILHKSVLGRYWYAIGYNESAAKYAGISTDQKRMISFVICSTLASLAGALFLLDVGTADPTNAGETLELYAITGAVLGGCSLKGGEGTAIGIVLGAAVLPLLRNVVSFLQIPDSIIPAVIGITLLLGTIADEFFRRRSSVGKK